MIDMKIVAVVVFFRSMNQSWFCIVDHMVVMRVVIVADGSYMLVLVWKDKVEVVYVSVLFSVFRFYFIFTRKIFACQIISSFIRNLQDSI